MRSEVRCLLGSGMGHSFVHCLGAVLKKPLNFPKSEGVEARLQRSGSRLEPASKGVALPAKWLDWLSHTISARSGSMPRRKRSLVLERRSS